MQAHYLQHVPFEGLGSIETWLKNAGYKTTVTRFYQSALLPDVETVDLLIILGGPMSANDEEHFPWLRMEKVFIRQIIEAGKPVIGICLGAQLIASSLGEAVYPNRRKEIGWFPVQGYSHQDESLFSFPEETEVFHWHGETFDLPPEGVLLASSDGCKNQAFQLGATVIGLQFHLEITPETVKALVNNCRDELQPSKFVQPEPVIIDKSPKKYLVLNELMGEILSFVTAGGSKNRIDCT